MATPAACWVALWTPRKSPHGPGIVLLLVRHPVEAAEDSHLALAAELVDLLRGDHHAGATASRAHDLGAKGQGPRLVAQSSRRPYASMRVICAPSPTSFASIAS